jgi:hypothetical protein
VGQALHRQTADVAAINKEYGHGAMYSDPAIIVASNAMAPVSVRRAG